MSRALQRNLFKAVKERRHAVWLTVSRVSPARLRSFLPPATRSRALFPISERVKGEHALPRPIYIHMYVYTHMYMFPFYFPFFSLFVFPRPTDRQFVSFVRCSFATVFFNAKTLGSVPLALLFHLFSLCRGARFRSKSDFTFVCACVRVHMCMCMCARAFRSSLFSY